MKADFSANPNKDLFLKCVEWYFLRMKGGVNAAFRLVLGQSEFDRSDSVLLFESAHYNPCPSDNLLEA